MNSILVTGAAAIIGQGIARSLRSAELGYRIVGLDRANNSYSASLCDAYHRKAHREDTPDYLPWLLSLIEQENVHLILPGIEEDMFFLHDHRHAWQDWPAKIVLSSTPAIEAGRDKWHLHQLMVMHQMPVIPTMGIGEWSDYERTLGRGPFIIKAKRGSGSRGQMILRSEDDWQRHRHQFNDAHIVQRVVGQDDEEYTVAMFGYGDGNGSSCAILKRRLWNGSTWHAEIVPEDAELEALCSKLNTLLTPLGPTNYQFRREGETWYLLEINPRISSSTSIRAGFGFNEAAMCVDYYLHQCKPKPGRLRRGICQRHMADHFEFA